MNTFPDDPTEYPVPETSNVGAPAIPESGERLLTAAEFQHLSETPPATEWFANIENPRTRRAYQNDVRHFMRFVGVREPAELRLVTRAHVIAWRRLLTGRQLAAATIRRKLAAVSSLFAYMCECNAIENNPAHGVARPKEGANEGKTSAISNAQARRLLNAPPADTLMGKRDRAILATLLYHGLRREELCRLEIRDMVERRGVMHIEVHGKGGRIRYLPMHPAASRWINEYLDAAEHEAGPLFIAVSNNMRGRQEPLHTDAIRQIVLRYAAAAGIDPGHFSPHSLRATAATNALEHGADIAEVQDWLGHRNPATTRLYDKRDQRPENSPTFRVAY